jgi:glycosyltransferase involved in cell wall biosynthesis
MTRVALLLTGLERGGAELQATALARELMGRGWDVAVFALRTGAPAADLAADLPVKPLTHLPKFRPHILHTHLFHANLAGRLMRLFLPIPVVISTVHSVAETGRHSTKIGPRDFLYRVTSPLADVTVFVCEAAAARHRLPRSRVIPNGIDTDRFRPDPERRARARAALDLGHTFTWLAAGRLMWKKNYPLMLEAMARQPAAVLLIAGAGPDESQLRALAGPNVRFLGTRGDMPDLMNAADAFVLSSTVEGLPTVLLEAAASGLPTVATDTGGVSEAVIHGRTGYVVPPHELAAAMQRVAAMPAGTMSQAARRHALSRFRLRDVAALWEQLYRELLEGRPPWT